MKLELKNLTKKYGDIVALKSLSYTFYNGVYIMIPEIKTDKTAKIS